MSNIKINELIECLDSIKDLKFRCEIKKRLLELEKRRQKEIEEKIRWKKLRKGVIKR